MTCTIKLTSVSLFSMTLLGCQGVARIWHRAGTDVREIDRSPRVILAADFGIQVRQDEDPAPNDSSDSAEDLARDEDDAGAKAARVQANQTDATDGASEPATNQPINGSQRQRTYTAPSAAVRQQALASASAASDDEDETTSITSAGREVAEAATGGATSFVGQPGLTASQPTVAGVVVSRPGLQEGPASGLGFASPFNILTPQTNPLSGTNGRCVDLVSAGFFGGSRTACESHFRRP